MGEDISGRREGGKKGLITYFLIPVVKISTAEASLQTIKTLLGSCSLTELTSDRYIGPYDPASLYGCYHPLAFIKMKITFYGRIELFIRNPN